MSNERPVGHSGVRCSVFDVRCSVFSILILITQSLRAADTNTDTNTPPAAPVPVSAPTPPPAVPSHFAIKSGFRIDRIAGEALVEDPGAMAFDEDGRLYVVELRDYPNRRNETPHLGRVRLLQDTNNDGIFDTSTIFADDLPLPSAVICSGGGAFVAAAPDILFLQDTNHDGAADVRKVVFTGFGVSEQMPVKPLMNSFVWGLDNRIHVASGGVDGTIVAAARGGSGVALEQADFAFDPRTLGVYLETGPAQSGMSFDARGRKFTSDFARPLRLPMYESGYLDNNPWFPKPPPMPDVISPAEPLLGVDAAALARADLSGHSSNNLNAVSRVGFMRARARRFIAGARSPLGTIIMPLSRTPRRAWCIAPFCKIAGWGWRVIARRAKRMVNSSWCGTRGCIRCRW